MALVEAYDTRTGRKYRVRPEAVGHPVIGKHLALTPRAKARGSKTADTAARTTRKATGKPAATGSADTAAPTIETPVAGDRKD